VTANINLPRILRVGAGVSGQLVATLKELGLARPLLVTDPYMQSCGYCERLLAPLGSAGIAYGLFNECVPDPTTDSVYAALAVMREGDYDSVVALGGGSSLDTAKAVAMLAEHGGIMRDYKVPRQAQFLQGGHQLAADTSANTQDTRQVDVGGHRRSGLDFDEVNFKHEGRIGRYDIACALLSVGQLWWASNTPLVAY
jgi:alcohol dehydrogenase class IV